MGFSIKNIFRAQSLVHCRQDCRLHFRRAMAFLVAFSMGFGALLPSMAAEAVVAKSRKVEKEKYVILDRVSGKVHTHSIIGHDFRELRISTNGDGKIDIWEITKGPTTITFRQRIGNHFAILDLEKRGRKGISRGRYKLSKDSKKYSLVAAGLSPYRHYHADELYFGGVCDMSSSANGTVKAFSDLLTQIQSAGQTTINRALACDIKHDQNLFFDPSCSATSDWKKSEQPMRQGLVDIMTSNLPTAPQSPKQYLACLNEHGLAEHAAKMEAELYGPTLPGVANLATYIGAPTSQASKAGATRNCSVANDIQPRPGEVPLIACREDAADRAWRGDHDSGTKQIVMKQSSVYMTSDKNLTSGTAASPRQAFASTMFHELLHLTGTENEDLVTAAEQCCSPPSKDRQKWCGVLDNYVGYNQPMNGVGNWLKTENAGRYESLLGISRIELGADGSANFLKNIYAQVSFDDEYNTKPSYNKCLANSGATCGPSCKTSCDKQAFEGLETTAISFAKSECAKITPMAGSKPPNCDTVVAAVAAAFDGIRNKTHPDLMALGTAKISGLGGPAGITGAPSYGNTAANSPDPKSSSGITARLIPVSPTSSGTMTPTLGSTQPSSPGNTVPLPDIGYIPPLLNIPPVPDDSVPSASANGESIASEVDTSNLGHLGASGDETPRSVDRPSFLPSDLFLSQANAGENTYVFNPTIPASINLKSAQMQSAGSGRSLSTDSPRTPSSVQIGTHSSIVDGDNSKPTKPVDSNTAPASRLVAAGKSGSESGADSQAISGGPSGGSLKSGDPSATKAATAASSLGNKPQAMADSPQSLGIGAANSSPEVMQTIAKQMYGNPNLFGRFLTGPYSSIEKEMKTHRTGFDSLCVDTKTVVVDRDGETHPRAYTGKIKYYKCIPRIDGFNGKILQFNQRSGSLSERGC
jgi:hypothetical protein